MNKQHARKHVQPHRKGQRKVLGYYVQEQHVAVALNGGLFLGCAAVMIAVFAI